MSPYMLALLEAKNEYEQMGAWAMVAVLRELIAREVGREE
jgi:hypothetical protein